MGLSKIRKHVPNLKTLYKTKRGNIKSMIGNSSPDLVHAICECAHNVLKGNVPLTTRQKRNLRKYKNKLRNLTKKRTSIKKKKLILQSGGFLPLLLGPALGFLTNLLTPRG